MAAAGLAACSSAARPRACSRIRSCRCSSSASFKPGRPSPYSRDMKYKDYYKIRGAFGRNVPIRGGDYETRLRISPDEAARGAEREFQIDGGSLRARIRKGGVDGQRLRLRGKGGPGMNGGPAGDLSLQIVLEPHP